MHISTECLQLYLRLKTKERKKLLNKYIECCVSKVATNHNTADRALELTLKWLISVVKWSEE